MCYTRIIRWIRITSLPKCQRNCNTHSPRTWGNIWQHMATHTHSIRHTWSSIRQRTQLYRNHNINTDQRCRQTQCHTHTQWPKFSEFQDMTTQDTFQVNAYLSHTLNLHKFKTHNHIYYMLTRTTIDTNKSPLFLNSPLTSFTWVVSGLLASNDQTKTDPDMAYLTVITCMHGRCKCIH